MRRTRHVVLPVHSWICIGFLLVSLACLTLGLVSRDREGRAGSLAGPELQHQAPHEIDACPNINPFTDKSPLLVGHESDRTSETKAFQAVEPCELQGTRNLDQISERTSRVEHRDAGRLKVDVSSRRSPDSVRSPLSLNRDFRSEANTRAHEHQSRYTERPQLANSIRRVQRDRRIVERPDTAHIDHRFHSVNRRSSRIDRFYRWTIEREDFADSNRRLDIQHRRSLSAHRRELSNTNRPNVREIRSNRNSLVRYAEFERIDRRGVHETVASGITERYEKRVFKNTEDKSYNHRTAAQSTGRDLTQKVDQQDGLTVLRMNSKVNRDSTHFDDVSNSKTVLRKFQQPFPASTRINRNKFDLNDLRRRSPNHFEHATERLLINHFTDSKRRLNQAESRNQAYRRDIDKLRRRIFERRVRSVEVRNGRYDRRSLMNLVTSPIQKREQQDSRYSPGADRLLNRKSLAESTERRQSFDNNFDERQNQRVRALESARMNIQDSRDNSRFSDRRTTSRERRNFEGDDNARRGRVLNRVQEMERNMKISRNNEINRRSDPNGRNQELRLSHRHHIQSAPLNVRYQRISLNKPEYRRSSVVQRRINNRVRTLNRQNTDTYEYRQTERRDLVRSEDHQIRRTEHTEVRKFNEKRVLNRNNDHLYIQMQRSRSTKFSERRFNNVALKIGGTDERESVRRLNQRIVPRFAEKESSRTTRDRTLSLDARRNIEKFEAFKDINNDKLFAVPEKIPEDKRLVRSPRKVLPEAQHSGTTFRRKEFEEPFFYLKEKASMNFEIIRQAFIMMLCTMYGTAFLNSKASTVGNIAERVSRFITG